MVSRGRGAPALPPEAPLTRPSVGGLGGCQGTCPGLRALPMLPVSLSLLWGQTGLLEVVNSGS